MCGERRREREKKTERILGGRVGNKGDKAAEGNDAALLRNVSNGCHFMLQVSSMVDVTVCQGEHKALRLILMYAATSLSDTLSALHL